MEGKRFLALALAALVVACGGASPSTSGPGGSSAAATGGTDATGAGSAGGGATTTSAANGPKLADLLANAKLASYKITYKMTVSGAGAGAFSGDQTWYFKPPRSRFDFSMDQGGQKLLISFFSLPDGTYYCFNAGQVQCLGVAGVGSPLDQNAPALAQRALIDNPSQYGATLSGTKSIAGQSASCYDVTSKSAGAFSNGSFCYTKDGIPMLSSFAVAGSTWAMEATNFSATVPDSDFALPAKPVSYP